jgi:hypothetical protein
MTSDIGTRPVKKTQRRAGADVESWLDAISPQNTDERRRQRGLQVAIVVGEEAAGSLAPVLEGSG